MPRRPPIVDPETLDEVDLFEDILYIAAEDLTKGQLETVYRVLGLMQKGKFRPELIEEIKRDFSGVIHD